MSRSMLVRIAAGCAALLPAALGAVVPAAAQSTSGGGASLPTPQYYRVYGYDTPLRGWLEPNLLETIVPNSALGDANGAVTHTAEVEYGVTDHFTIGGYGDFTSGAGSSFRLRQSRVLARYRFAQRYDVPWNTGLYAEYYFPDRSAGGQHLEVRFIADRDYNDFRWLINPILEVGTSGGVAGTKPVYSLNSGIYYRRHFAVQPGFEVFSAFGEVGTAPDAGAARITVFPVVTLQAGKATARRYIHVHGGSGFRPHAQRRSSHAQSVLHLRVQSDPAAELQRALTACTGCGMMACAFPFVRAHPDARASRRTSAAIQAICVYAVARRAADVRLDAMHICEQRAPVRTNSGDHA